jgi:hypothetical protein
MEPSCDRPLPRSFERRVVVVAPGTERAFDACEWRDAIVVVARGAIVLESVHGVRRAFAPGDLLWLTGLGLRALCNDGDEPAVLVAVSRR